MNANLNYRIDNKLSLKKKKNRLYIVDSIINYPLTLTDLTISCPCLEFSKIRADNCFCKHVMFYLAHCEFDFNLLQHWIKMKKHILLELIKCSSNNTTIDNAELWKIVESTIFDAECGFCLEKIKITASYHICRSCGGITHEKCFDKWKKSGNKKDEEPQEKNCILCRAID